MSDFNSSTFQSHRWNWRVFQRQFALWPKRCDLITTALLFTTLILARNISPAWKEPSLKAIDLKQIFPEEVIEYRKSLFEREGGVTRSRAHCRPSTIHSTLLHLIRYRLRQPSCGQIFLFLVRDSCEAVSNLTPAFPFMTSSSTRLEVMTTIRGSSFRRGTCSRAATRSCSSIFISPKDSRNTDLVRKISA